MNLRILLLLLFILSSTFCYAENNSTEEKLYNPSVNDSPIGSFAGLQFGVGVSLTDDIGNNKRVGRATVVNGVVRVTEEENDIARVMLESHYFFTPDFDFLVSKEQWGWGPFISLQPGTNEIIEAVGVGLMLGFKRESHSLSSWNIGLGFVIDPSVSILGDGVKENQPVPVGEQTVRFKETSQIGLLLLTSFSF